MREQHEWIKDTESMAALHHLKSFAWESTLESAIKVFAEAGHRHSLRAEALKTTEERSVAVRGCLHATCVSDTIASKASSCKQANNQHYADNAKNPFFHFSISFH